MSGTRTDNSTSWQPVTIGIITYHRNEADRYFLPGTYVDAVRAVGGVPLLLPPGERRLTLLVDLVDGLLFAGGGDIAPSLYHALPHPANDTIDHERDATELALARLALSTALPVLGICRGIQVLGVAGGSTLVQHIPDVYGSKVAHRADPPGPIEHHVEIEPHSRLAHIVAATSLPVQSWHHQALQSAPPGWRSVAYAGDGVIEAIEHEHHPWMVGVQWHPELTCETLHHRRLFNALIHAAEERRAGECGRTIDA